VYQTVINQIPPHRVYIEPFAGMGGVFRKKQAADTSIMIDLSNEVVEFWENRGFERMRVWDTRAADQGRYVYRGNALTFLAGNLPARWNNEQTVLYVDPPYPLATRRSSHRYDHELTDAEHDVLLNILLRLQCRILLSTYPNDLYRYKLTMAGWRLIEFQARTRGGTMATEWLWMNFPEPTTLHDYRYAGGDYRQRERIRKRVKRFMRKFGQMDPLERNAILEAINQATGGRSGTAETGDSGRNAMSELVLIDQNHLSSFA
jgi:hypothetical protein